MEVGDKIKVKPEFDIPELLRPSGRPSEGVIERIEGDTILTLVEGKCVPYSANELEVV